MVVHELKADGRGAPNPGVKREGESDLPLPSLGLAQSIIGADAAVLLRVVCSEMPLARLQHVLA